ncbi:LysE family translocator [Inquilinus sp. NPDC058860]|uniref:LysE family translocator n=1 Tax=Inquilinus sp. NPDC058860 TaxID=3346652 RepID=UPI0036874DB9
MFDPATLALFMAAALALNLTPGPDMLFCFANGVARGPRAGLAAALGIGGGAAVHTLAAALGLAGLFAASPAAFEILRWGGAAYLLWLAMKALRSTASGLGAAGPLPPRPAGRIFLDGMVTNVLNPKVALFFIAFLPQFVDPAHSAALQILVLGTLLNLSGTAVNALVGMSSGGLGQLLSRRPIVARLLNGFTGIVFLGLAARLVLADGRPK